MRDRAAGQCEYCRLPQAATSVPFEIDHIISRKHHGPTIASNLANACWYCNTFKGSDISGLDPRTRKLTRLFHPRRHKWTHHFRYDGPVLLGRTAIGRTTIRVLQINCDDALTLRESLTVTDFGGDAVFAGFHEAPRFRCRSRNSLWPSKLSAPIFRQPTSVQQSLLPFPRP